MSHLDEGTLHALLDGELDLHEVREIQAHLGSCTACDSRFQAAKDVYGEADRLVASVQFPGALKGMQEQEAPRAAAAPTPPPAVPPGAKQRRIEAKPVTNVGIPQVVILPEQNDWPGRRRRWMAAAKWAAVFCVAVGAGFLASEARKNSEPVGSPAMRAADTDEPNWVVSQDEMTEAESLVDGGDHRRQGGEHRAGEAHDPGPKEARGQGCAEPRPRRRHRPRAPWPKRSARRNDPIRRRRLSSTGSQKPFRARRTSGPRRPRRWRSWTLNVAASGPRRLPQRSIALGVTPRVRPPRPERFSRSRPRHRHRLHSSSARRSTSGSASTRRPGSSADRSMSSKDWARSSWGWFREASRPERTTIARRCGWSIRTPRAG